MVVYGGSRDHKKRMQPTARTARLMRAVEHMKSVIISLGILVALAINHAVHGLGCWGLQPGGRFSSLLYWFQAIVAVVGLVWVCYRVIKGRERRRFVVAACIGLLAAGAIVAYVGIGWRIDTSIHNQGPENLIPFCLVSLVAITTGGYRWLIRGRK